MHKQQVAVRDHVTCAPISRSASDAPPAMRIWACTRSTPVTSSVHVCSTCRTRVLGLM